MALWVNAPMERILLLAILHEVHRQTQKCEWPPETQKGVGERQKRSVGIEKKEKQI